MSKKVKIKLNRAGVRALLLSSDIAAAVDQAADFVLQNCGQGYAKEPVYMGKNRSNVQIYPATKEARKDNYNNNTLLKAIG